MASGLTYVVFSKKSVCVYNVICKQIFYNSKNLTEHKGVDV